MITKIIELKANLFDIQQEINILNEKAQTILTQLRIEIQKEEKTIAEFKEKKLKNKEIEKTK